MPLAAKYQGLKTKV